MNLPKENDKPDDSQHLEFLEWVVRYQDGALSSAEVEKLAEMICQDPAKGKLFRRMQIRTSAIHDLLRMDAFGQTSRLLDQELEGSIASPVTPLPPTESGYWRSFASRRNMMLLTGVVSLSLLVVMGSFIWNGPGFRTALTRNAVPETDPPQVLLVEEIRAKFFGPKGLMSGDVVAPQQDYMLQSGLVKLKFPSGAIAILEAPSIFRVATIDSLVLNTGACSVHAPPGAEGFEVITPVTKVVDRGTRFYVRVQENNETEVHVIEGAADLYAAATTAPSPAVETVQDSHPAESVRLTHGEAMRVGGFIDSFGQRMKSHSESYRAQLPDRLVDYQASSTTKGTVDELTSVTVQRNGQLHAYSIDELIPIEVTSFCADPIPDTNGYLCGFLNKPNRPEEWLEDRNLTTGLINFGGQPLPLTHRPVISSNSTDPSEATPGLGIRFRSPVVNHAGPDVLLFEIQSFSNDQDGDPFHVYSFADRPDLKPFTVTKFDLTMDSPVTREVAPLWSHRFLNSMRSLTELQEAEAPIKVDVGPLHFRVIGVGIDLSELGFAEGEEVNELFFQHAADEKASKVDTVFIAGLPPVNPEK